MGEYMGSVSLTSRGLASHSHSSKMALSWLVKVSLVVAVVKAQEFQKEADKALNCPAREKARKGDRVFISYKGLLADGSTFDEGIAEFSLGEGKVIPGWEKGFLGQCAGESITMVIPPELGYGDIGADKVPAGSTLYFLTELRGIARTTKEPLGGDCNEGQKVRDGQDVSLRLNVRVSTRDGRGKNIIDKPSYEFRVGKCRSLECGLEKVLTGACVDEKLLLMLGPQLAYGRRGNKSGTVGPNTSLVVETEVLRVRNKKPEDKNLVLGFLDKISSGNLGSFRDDYLMIVQNLLLSFSK